MLEKIKSRERDEEGGGGVSVGVGKEEGGLIRDASAVDKITNILPKETGKDKEKETIKGEVKKIEDLSKSR